MSVWTSLSLVSRGSRTQVATAFLLSSVVPLLAFAVAIGSDLSDLPYGTWGLWLLVGSVLMLMALGYILMAGYVANIVRLRRYLATLAEGKLPEAIKLVKWGDDVAAIEKYMGAVVKQAQSRIDTIEAQTRSLLETEQQRVMIESIGAACHHLGQPLTVLLARLALMKREDASPAVRMMVQETCGAAEEVADVMARLQRVTHYRTEEYLPRPAGNQLGQRTDERILLVSKAL